MLDYSQNGEQRIITDFFLRRTGTFLDLGANDGSTLSNSRALSLIGWRGVCVEPAEIAFKKLRSLYADSPEIVCVNAAITTEDGPIDFYDSGTHLNKGDTSLLSTTRPEEMVRWKRSGEQFTKTTVRGITFRTLLAESPYKHFDFISVDCEGVDYEILTQIDLTEVGCQMLCVETNGKENEKFIAYAAGHGMTLHHKNYENLIFVKKTH